MSSKTAKPSKVSTVKNSGQILHDRYCSAAGGAEERSLLRSQQELTGSVTTNTRELVWTYTDLFDFNIASESTKPVLAVGGDVSQAFMSNDSPAPTGGDDRISRVKRIEAYCLPRAANGNVSGTSFIAASAVLCEAASGGPKYLTNTRNTLVNPDFNINWQKILDVNAAELWGDNLVLPIINADNRIDLFRLAILNPDTGAILYDFPVQIMYRVTMAEVIPAAAQAKVASEYVTAWNTAANTKPSLEFAMVQVKNVQNRT